MTSISKRFIKEERNLNDETRESRKNDRKNVSKTVAKYRKISRKMVDRSSIFFILGSVLIGRSNMTVSNRSNSQGINHLPHFEPTHLIVTIVTYILIVLSQWWQSRENCQKIVSHVSDGNCKINRGPIVKSSLFHHSKLVTICELTISQFVHNFMVSTGWYCYWYGGGEKFIQNKNITTTTIGTITLGLNNMFVFETFVEHHLELTLGTDVQFKPPSRSNIFYRRSMQ